jgi:hypothetical protein
MTDITYIYVSADAPAGDHMQDGEPDCTHDDGHQWGTATFDEVPWGPVSQWDTCQHCGVRRMGTHR